MPLPFPTSWLVPDWPAPPDVQAVFTSRACPVGDAPSAAPWNGFNLATHVGDSPQAVAAHRAALKAALGARPVFLEQVHGCNVAILEEGVADGLLADAAVTTHPNLACTVMVADCLSVLLTLTNGAAVAAVHAGWRGLANGVIEAAVQTLRSLDQSGHLKASAAYATHTTDLMAWLGPCIGPGSFEVGPEVRAAFMAASPEAAAGFVPLSNGKWLANLPTLARQRLNALGVRVWGNDASTAWCTFSQPQRFYSYRAQAITGRMAACIFRHHGEPTTK